MACVTITAKAEVKDEEGVVHDSAQRTWTDLDVMKVSQCRAWCTRQLNTMVKRSEGVRFVRASYSGFSQDNMCSYDGGTRALVKHGQIEMQHFEGSMDRDL